MNVYVCEAHTYIHNTEVYNGINDLPVMINDTIYSMFIACKIYLYINETIYSMFIACKIYLQYKNIAICNICFVHNLRPSSIKCVNQSRYRSPQLRDNHALSKHLDISRLVVNPRTPCGCRGSQEKLLTPMSLTPANSAMCQFQILSWYMHYVRKAAGKRERVKLFF